MEDGTISSTMIPLMEARQLRVGWHDKAVADLGNFTLESGQITVIAGPNGVGKSTAVKTLARVLPPLGGDILISGNSIKAFSQQDFARAVAYVPQSMNMTNELTVFELISLGRAPHQRWWSWQANQEDRLAIENALVSCGLEHYKDRLIGSLSGGERQRVTIATALAQQSKVIILDEPTSALDLKHQLEVLDLMAQLRQKGLAVALVMHDLNLIARTADKVILLQPSADGPASVGAAGSPEEVLTPDVIRKIYDVDVTSLKDPKSGMVAFICHHSTR